MKIAFVLHADFEKPGMLETWAKKGGFSYQIHRPFAKEALPKPSDFDWLIVMGGPQSACELGSFPYLQEEVNLIIKAINQDKVILGFCLGAQLIGVAFGAEAQKSPNKEVGIFPIELTKEGVTDPLLQGLPRKFPVVHWHNDMPGLTDKAVILAKSEGCPRQIVRYGKSIYGFQCHLEPTRQNIEEMIENCAADLAPAKFVQSQEEIERADFSEINSYMTKILENLNNFFIS